MNEISRKHVIFIAKCAACVDENDTYAHLLLKTRNWVAADFICCLAEISWHTCPTSVRLG